MPQGEQNTAITVPVIPGMRDDLEPFAAPPGTITVARNVRFPAVGVVQSRRGRAALSTASAADVSYSDVLDTSKGPDFLHPCGDGFVFGASGFSYLYSASKGVSVGGSYANAQPRGVLDTITREELTPSEITIRAPWPLSCAVAAGLVVTCHSEGNGQSIDGVQIAGTQRDPINPAGTAGALIRIFSEDGTILSSAYFDDMNSAAVVSDPVANNVIIFYQNGTDLRTRVIAADGTIGASASIGTLSTATSFWAACSWNMSAAGAAVVYQSAAAQLTIKRIHSAGVVATQTIAITAGASAPVSIYGDATNLYVGWALRGGASYDTQAQVFDTTLTNTSAIVTLYSPGAAAVSSGPPLFGACAVAGAAFVLVSHCFTTPFPGNNFTRPFALGNTGVLVTGADQQMIAPLSAPFANGMFWARLGSPWGASLVQYQRTALLDMQLARVGSASSVSSASQYAKVALICDAFASDSTLDVMNTPENYYLEHLYPPVQLSSGEWVMGVPRLVRKERQKTSAGSTFGYLMLCEWLKFAVGVDQQVKTCRGDVICSGSPTIVSYSAGTYQYANPSSTLADQTFGLDLGFFIPPGMRAQSSATPGDLVAGSVYQYRVIPELIDVFGRRHRGVPSIPYPVTIAAGQSSVSGNIYYPSTLLRVFSLYPVNSRMVVGNYRSLAAGSNFQRTSPAQGDYAIYTTATTALTDLNSDTYVAAREYLYTDGGVLQNDHPPSCRFITATEDRVWLAGLWDTSIAQSSKLLVPGEPVQFSDSDAFKVMVPGAITGIAAQDGIVIIFTADSVYAIQGLGPNDQGQGSWDSPRCITKSAGCVDWRSIVETSAGVFFQSERGIMLLPRGAGEPQYIGWPIQDTIGALGGTITGASVCQTTESATVRFCLASGMLIYDLETQCWSYDTASGGIIHTKVCDTENGPTFARKALAANVGFDQEQEALTQDAGVDIPSYVEWAPVRAGTLASWCAFTGAITTFGKLDGAAYPATALTVSCQVDNDTTNTKTKATMADMTLTDYRRLPLGQYRQGSVATLSFATSGAPWRFVGWTLELEPQQGTRNVRPNTEQY
jgi:hypothetical protein